MKPRRRILLAAIGLAFAAVLVFALLPAEKEPEYQGKKLSEWLLTYVNPTGNDPVRQDQAFNAVRHIGTNALPFLVKWISYREPNWRNKLADVFVRVPISFPRTRVVHLVLGSSGTRARVAMLGFQILREDAAPTVPALTNLLGDWNAQETTFRVLSALSCVGREGLPPLVAVVANKAVPAKYRYDAATTIASQSNDLGTNASWAMQTLLPYLEDANVAAPVARLLGRLTLAPEKVVPALSKCLASPEIRARIEAASALGQFGTEASSAVPDLVVATSDSREVVRIMAANALMKIAPEMLKKDEH